MGVPPWVFCMMQGSELGDSWIEIDSNVFKMAFEKENVCSYVHAVMPWSTTCCRRQSNSNFLEIINGRTNQIVVEARIHGCSKFLKFEIPSFGGTWIRKTITMTTKTLPFIITRSSIPVKPSKGIVKDTLTKTMTKFQWLWSSIDRGRATIWR